MLFVWGVAGILGGRVLLRIEDHDRRRCRGDYEVALLADMEWLGFEPANFVSPGPSKHRQSDCDAVYGDALRRLARVTSVYRCVCTRKSLARLRDPGLQGEMPYPGLCRRAGHPESVSHGLRLAWKRDERPESFEDGFLGQQCQRPERQCGDLLVRDRLGQWTYQFAVTVDDLRHGVDFVVRGEDLVDSTGRQIRLARMLGRPDPPRYFHHPLARDGQGVKLSKKQRAPSVRAMRQAGMAPGTVLGEAARAVGLVPDACELAARDAAELVERAHRQAFRNGREAAGHGEPSVRVRRPGAAS